MTSAGSNGTAAPSPPLLPQNCVDLDIRQTEALGDLAGEQRFTAAVADYCDALHDPGVCDDTIRDQSGRSNPYISTLRN